ncbi:hypothetical protein D9611_007615 [Ephemerocybe angulata]|uniref:Uncharacterized protein n=1 Tax=Ephemerocybe angulata TaxID=980116 RepID=A0A8H5BYI2_9AGAR|nr:hypothetical protein D9611_007615 [Tulosesus angulatus]
MFRLAARSARPLRVVRPAARTFATSRCIREEHRQPTSLDTFTEEEQMLRESVRRFAVDVVGPKVREMDENEMMDPSIIKGLFEQGLMGIETSAEHSGAECSFTSAIIAIEELAKIDPSVSVLCDVHNTLVNTVVRKYGTKEQQDKYLPKLSESWIDPSKGYKGITCFIVEKDMGIQVAKKEQKLGIRASSTCTLSFDDVKVPEENVLGGEGNGYKIAIEILNEGRIGIAAQMLGLAQGAFDKAVPYTFERKQFGQPIGTFQSMQHQMAKAAIEIEAARLLTYNAARRKEEGLSFTREAAMAKYYASVVAQNVSGQAIEWCGGIGFTRETGIEKYWRDSKIGAIYEGTSNIQLQTIANGIGLESSILFAQEGANVLLVDVNIANAEKAAALVQERFPNVKAIPYKADVSKEAEVEAAVATAVKEFGRLDVMFNNAGIMHPEDDNALNTEERIWDLTMNINLKGVWFGCKHAIKAMRENPTDAAKGLQTGGSIINTASFVAIMGAATPQLAWSCARDDPRACHGACARRYPPELALPWSPEDSLYIPLYGKEWKSTELHSTLALLMDFLNTDEKKQRRLVHLPMGRFGEAVELANAALFRKPATSITSTQLTSDKHHTVASSESSYITGTDFKVDGGLSSAYVTALGEPALPPPTSLVNPA